MVAGALAGGHDAQLERKLGLELRGPGDEGVQGAALHGDEHHDGKFAAEDGHLAFLDIAAALRYQAREVVDDAHPVGADGRENRVCLAHGGIVPRIRETRQSLRESVADYCKYPSSC